MIRTIHGDGYVFNYNEETLLGEITTSHYSVPVPESTAMMIADATEEQRVTLVSSAIKAFLERPMAKRRQQG